MNPIVIWVAIAVVLGVAEIVTGTFYLLVYAVAAALSAAASALGLGTTAQVLMFIAGCAVGTVLVRGYHARRPRHRDVPHDVGQQVTLSAALDDSNRRWEVLYRGTRWEAQLSGDAAGARAGACAVIEHMNGSTLVVRLDTPAVSGA